MTTATTLAALQRAAARTGTATLSDVRDALRRRGELAPPYKAVRDALLALAADGHAEIRTSRVEGLNLYAPSALH